MLMIHDHKALSETTPQGTSPSPEATKNTTINAVSARIVTTAVSIIATYLLRSLYLLSFMRHHTITWCTRTIVAARSAHA